VDSLVVRTRPIRPKINQKQLFDEVKKRRDDILTSERQSLGEALTRPIGQYGEEKLRILREYFYSYSAIVSNYFKEFIYLETCSGPGVCTLRESGRVVLGTPLLAMTNKPVFTKYYFVELDDKAHEALTWRRKSYCPDANVEIVHDDCNNCIGSIVQKIPKNIPVLAVMDPEGLELKWNQTVAPIAAHPRSEIFINFPYDMAIKRCISPNLSPATELTVTECLGTEEWKPLRDAHLRGEISAEDLRDAFLDLYTDGLRKLGLMEVQVSRLVRRDNNSPLYFLVSASRKQIARSIMKDIMKIDVSRQTTILND
jgi:three-Cys-motif partner protein